MKQLIIIILAIISLTYFTRCGSYDSAEADVNGTWVSVGSGWYLNIFDSTTYDMYDFTNILCLPKRSASFKELSPDLKLDSDTLYYHKGIISYPFVRIEKLPDLCMISLKEEEKGDPLLNFDVFAATVNDHYAFKDLNQIDWPKIQEQQRQKLNSKSSDVELYQVIEETIELLNDNHGYLEATDEVYEAIELLESDANEPDTNESELVEEEREYGDFEVAGLVTKSYLTEEMTKDSWQIQWGKMENNIGYIQIKLMWLYAKLDIPKELKEEIGYVDAYVQTFSKMNESEYIDLEVKAATSIMDRVMTDLKDSDKIVIDVRFNGGGQDAVSLALLSYFNDQRKVVAKERLNYKGSLTPQQDIYLEAHQNPYLKPVYILTSPQTGSAAEVFALASLTLPNVKRIGSNTSGAISTALEKSLPNGWKIALSDELFMDTEGRYYENVGVPVSYEFSYSRDRQEFFRFIVKNVELDKNEIIKIINNL